MAIKQVRKKDLKIVEIFQMRREIDILKMCQHPNVNKLVDVFENASYHFLVLEIINGKNLYDYLKLRNFKLSEPRVKSIVL